MWWTLLIVISFFARVGLCFELGPGEVLFLESEAERAVFLENEFLPVNYLGKRGFFIAVPLETKPGTYPVRLVSETPKVVLLKVREKRFPEEHIEVPPKMVYFDEETLRRIKQEVALVRSAVRVKKGMECRWDEPFIWPVHGRISSPFGLRRFFNGEPRAPHSGIDIAVPSGTPVKASQKGKVVLSREFYLLGKVVVISHGCGLYTLYAHLKELKVREGEVVKRGQVIGLSGASGRATGPHLHFGFYISGVKVDPMEVLKLLETGLAWR